MNCLNYIGPSELLELVNLKLLLLAQVYQLDLSRPRFSFLLGSEANDEATHVVSSK